jgi:amphi-Trp domain-containing protein
MEKTLFESESEQHRSDIATYLRRVADNLDDGEPITLRSGEESVTLTPPETPTFEVKAEREGAAGTDGELSIEFELEWHEGDDDGDLVIE